jgi:hypothetical protein
LKPEERNSVVTALQHLTGKMVTASQIIIVHYFYKEPVKTQAPCIDHYTSDKNYIKYIDRHSGIAQFFITENGFTYSRKSVIEDTGKIIHNLLFKDVMHCGNYLIIKPNGHYYKRVGEYRQDDIQNKIKGDW